ncbi:MAG: GGDEF domain-containing protein [Planctomycetota bacterium]|jgi:diguanylate cyclase (GGDEF)-like protein
MEIVCAAFAAAALLVAFWQYRRAETARALARCAHSDARERTINLRRLHQSLRRQVALLEATRDLSLITNEDASFDRIVTALAHVLKRIASPERAELFIVDGKGALERRARFGRGVATVCTATAPPGSAAAAEGELFELALAATAESNGFTETDENGLVRVVMPLSANRERLGVLVCELDGRHRDDETLQDDEQALRGLQTPIALAVHKPTLYERAVHDSLTGLFNKRHFNEQCDRFVSQCGRTGEPLSLIMVDLDRFKQVNDTYGHLAGDCVLQEIARIVKDKIRGYDLAFRYGGEELCVLAPLTELESARRLAERLREAVEAARIEAGNDLMLRVTASFGIGQFDPARGITTRAALIEAADRALYRSKNHGRNCVLADGDPEPGRQRISGRTAPPAPSMPRVQRPSKGSRTQRGGRA